MRPIDTMPKEGRFLVNWDGVYCIAHAREDGVLVEGYVYPRTRDSFLGWSPLPDADSRVVTRAELEELAAKDARISELEGKVASLEARVSELAMTTGDDADGLRSAWAKVQELEDQLALRDREIARLKEDIAGLKCVRGYQADWIAINKALDEHRRAIEREIRQCRGCGCLVAGGPSACVRCAEAGA